MKCAARGSLEIQDFTFLCLLPTVTFFN